MKVTDILEKADRPLISFEIIPPQRGGDFRSLIQVIEDIATYKPPFIDITSHSAEVVYDETPNGIKKRIVRKRPGTLGICALIQNKFNIEAVPHILCKNFTREETEDFLIELNYIGVQNVLAIQGDDKGFNKALPDGRTSNKYASDLVEQVKDMNAGKFLEKDLLDAQPSNFCVGASAYPEKHYTSPNLKTDLFYTKQKVDKGADYLVTQMFFDNKVYFDYLKAARDMDIKVPIIPGLKIITSRSHLTNIPAHFHINLPEDLTGELLEARPDQILDIGIEWAAKQVIDLLDNGVPTVHFYIMQSSKPVKKLMDKLKLFPKYFPGF